MCVVVNDYERLWADETKQYARNLLDERRRGGLARMRLEPLRLHPEHARFGTVWENIVAANFAHLAAKLVTSYRLLHGESMLIESESLLSIPQEEGELEAYGTCECRKCNPTKAQIGPWVVTDPVKLNRFPTRKIIEKCFKADQTTPARRIARIRDKVDNLIQLRQTDHYKANPASFNVHLRIKDDPDLRDYFHGDSGSGGQDDPRLSKDLRAAKAIDAVIEADRFIDGRKKDDPASGAHVPGAQYHYLTLAQASQLVTDNPGSHGSCDGWVKMAAGTARCAYWQRCIRMCLCTNPKSTKQETFVSNRSEELCRVEEYRDRRGQVKFRKEWVTRPRQGNLLESDRHQAGLWIPADSMAAYLADGGELPRPGWPDDDDIAMEEPEGPRHPPPPAPAATVTQPIAGCTSKSPPTGPAQHSVPTGAAKPLVAGCASKSPPSGPSPPPGDKDDPGFDDANHPQQGGTWKLPEPDVPLASAGVTNLLDQMDQHMEQLDLVHQDLPDQVDQDVAPPPPQNEDTSGRSPSAALGAPFVPPTGKETAGTQRKAPPPPADPVSPRAPMCEYEELGEGCTMGSTIMYQDKWYCDEHAVVRSTMEQSARESCGGQGPECHWHEAPSSEEPGSEAEIDVHPEGDVGDPEEFQQPAKAVGDSLSVEHKSMESPGGEQNQKDKKFIQNAFESLQNTDSTPNDAGTPCEFVQNGKSCSQTAEKYLHRFTFTGIDLPRWYCREHARIVQQYHSATSWSKQEVIQAEVEADVPAAASSSSVPAPTGAARRPSETGFSLQNLLLPPVGNSAGEAKRSAKQFKEAEEGKGLGKGGVQSQTAAIDHPAHFTKWQAELWARARRRQDPATRSGRVVDMSLLTDHRAQHLFREVTGDGGEGRNSDRYESPEELLQNEPVRFKNAMIRYDMLNAFCYGLRGNKAFAIPSGHWDDDIPKGGGRHDYFAILTSWQPGWSAWDTWCQFNGSDEIVWWRWNPRGGPSKKGKYDYERNRTAGFAQNDTKFNKKHAWKVLATLDTARGTAKQDKMNRDWLGMFAPGNYQADGETLRPHRYKGQENATKWLTSLIAGWTNDGPRGNPIESLLGICRLTVGGLPAIRRFEQKGDMDKSNIGIRAVEIRCNSARTAILQLAIYDCLSKDLCINMDLTPEEVAEGRLPDNRPWMSLDPAVPPKLWPVESLFYRDEKMVEGEPPVPTGTAGGSSGPRPDPGSGRPNSKRSPGPHPAQTTPEEGQMAETPGPVQADVTAYGKLEPSTRRPDQTETRSSQSQRGGTSQTAPAPKGAAISGRDQVFVHSPSVKELEKLKVAIGVARADSRKWMEGYSKLIMKIARGFESTNGRSNRKWSGLTIRSAGFGWLLIKDVAASLVRNRDMQHHIRKSTVSTVSVNRSSATWEVELHESILRHLPSLNEHYNGEFRWETAYCPAWLIGRPAEHAALVSEPSIRILQGHWLTMKPFLRPKRQGDWQGPRVLPTQLYREYDPRAEFPSKENWAEFSEQRLGTHNPYTSAEGCPLYLSHGCRGKEWQTPDQVVEAIIRSSGTGELLAAPPGGEGPPRCFVHWTGLDAVLSYRQIDEVYIIVKTTRFPSDINLFEVSQHGRGIDGQSRPTGIYLTGDIKDLMLRNALFVAKKHIHRVVELLKESKEVVEAAGLTFKTLNNHPEILKLLKERGKIQQNFCFREDDNNTWWQTGSTLLSGNRKKPAANGGW
ncbi:MAG: hypothetical protein OTJ97_03165 [SAR202 cluster bacterium]|nr:hypothetical protein [SAR202 cluster bacterium]